MKKTISFTKIYRPDLSHQFSLLFISIFFISFMIHEIYHKYRYITLENIHEKWVYIIYVILIIIGILFPIYELITNYLKITPSGIEYHELGCSIYVKWREITGIHKYRKNLYLHEDLLIENPKVTSPSWMMPMFIISEADQRIPIRRFDSDWRSHELGKFIMEQIIDNGLKNVS